MCLVKILLAGLRSPHNSFFLFAGNRPMSEYLHLFKINIMGFIIKVLLTAVAAYAAAWLLPGVEIVDIKTTVIVALVLALLNTFVKPILILLTIPVTILTLGLFLLVINILIIKWTDSLVGGFTVDGWWSALLFSLIVSIVTWMLSGLIDRD